MEDYGVGNQVIITFEVVKDSNGHHTPDANYQENGLSPDAISSRYSTVNEYIFITLLVAGLGIVFYGGLSSFRVGRPTVMAPDDDWGFPQAPPVAPAAPMTPPQPQFPPITAAIPQPAPVSPPPQPVPQPVGAPSTMTITVPPGVVSGQVLTVTMPNGQVVNVEVPPGCSSGSQFTITVKQ
jgi:hypothetical protein